MSQIGTIRGGAARFVREILPRFYTRRDNRGLQATRQRVQQSSDRFQRSKLLPLFARIKADKHVNTAARHRTCKKIISFIHYAVDFGCRKSVDESCKSLFPIVETVVRGVQSPQFSIAGTHFQISSVILGPPPSYGHPGHSSARRGNSDRWYPTLRR